MYPVLFSIGPIHIASFSVFILMAWGVFSFLFWKSLRSQAVEEERIFDLTFSATLAALVGARVGFVFFHQDQFVDAWLATVALWVRPGLSLYGGLLAGMLVLVSGSRTGRIRLGHVLDAVAFALPLSLAVGKIGSLLDGSEIGLPANLPWAMLYVGHAGRRHPVQIYELVALLLLFAVVVRLGRKAAADKWPYGKIGVWLFLLFAPLAFTLEFFKESSVYFSLRANQWVLMLIFAEALGAFYVRGGGREALQPVVRSASRCVSDAIKRGILRLRKGRTA